MYNKEKNVADYGINAINPHRWIEKYADYLYAYAVFRVDDSEQAKDLVQETFLAALEKIEKFEGRSSEITFLTSIEQGHPALKRLPLANHIPNFLIKRMGTGKLNINQKNSLLMIAAQLTARNLITFCRNALKNCPCFGIQHLR